MFDDPISQEFRDALSDWFEGAELVDFLGITVEEIVEAFPEKILEQTKALRIELRMDIDDEEDDVNG